MSIARPSSTRPTIQHRPHATVEMSLSQCLLIKCRLVNSVVDIKKYDVDESHESESTKMKSMPMSEPSKSYAMSSRGSRSRRRKPARLSSRR
jgi:hypothetical protein